MQDFSQSRSHYQKEQAGYQAAYTELCRHLEHAPLEQLLSDHTAVLVFGTAPERRDEVLRMIKGQLYSRNSRDTGRVESWFTDCCARIQEDREGFLQNAQLTYIRQGLAEEERQQKAAKAAKERGRFRVRPASAFAPETAEYLVEPYLPKGMLSILGGVSGVGKTSLALDICARLSRGETPPVIACGDASPLGDGASPQALRASSPRGSQLPQSAPGGRSQLPQEGALSNAANLPTTTKASSLGEVASRSDDGRSSLPHPAVRPILYLTAENDPNKVLRPRAEAMGADLDKLYFQDGASYSMGDAELAALCRALRPGLLVFDPIQSYLGQGVQMNRAEQVRPLLDSLSALAKELDMAVLLISHMSKPGPGVCSALDRLLGSSDFRNAARSILIAGRDPEHPDTRVVAHAKNSLGVPGESQRYHINENGTVAYDGPCDLPADRIIQETGAAQRTQRPAATLNAAVEALDKQLSFVGWVEYAEVERLCAKYGFSESTMRRAKAVLGLNLVRVGMQPNQKTYWYRSELDKDAVQAEIMNINHQLQMSS